MLWSPIDVAEALHQEGITGRGRREIGVAVCWAESHGDDQARLDNTTLTPPGKGIDRGLFQINSFWQPQVTDEMAFDGAENIRQAVAIYRANGATWNPWVTYRTGAYKRYLEMGECAVEAALRLRAVKRDLDSANLKAANYFTQIAALQGELDVKTIRLEAASTELTSLRAMRDRVTAWCNGLVGG